MALGFSVPFFLIFVVLVSYFLFKRSKEKSDKESARLLAMSAMASSIPRSKSTVKSKRSSFYDNMFKGEDSPPDTLTSPSLFRYQVLAAYVPVYNDELELSEGDCVVIQEIYEDGYCLGYRLIENSIIRKGEVGIFPLNCTRVSEERSRKSDAGSILRSVHGKRWQSLGASESAV
jgi:hypothetical protein